MSYSSSAKQTNLTCTEQSFPEFPDALFGKSTEGIAFFDATHYLQKQGRRSTLSVEQFFQQYEPIISSLIVAYKINEEDLHLVNKEGHHLIDGNLLYLFIAYVEPDFWAYIFDRIQDMFSIGFCLSDSLILQSARERLSSEVLSAAVKDE